jgi:hypothetical protein
VSTAREKALAAFSESPEEKARRLAEERAQRERELEEEVLRRETAVFQKMAKREIKARLGIDAGAWKVIEGSTTFTVLRDPEDEKPFHHALTLCVSKRYAQGNMVIHYQPYEFYGEDDDRDRRAARTPWHTGPIVRSLVELGAAIAAHEKWEAAIARSMPAHLP